MPELAAAPELAWAPSVCHVPRKHGAKSATGRSPVVCPTGVPRLTPQLFITALVRGSLWVTFKGQGQQLGSDYELIDKSTRIQKDLKRSDGRLAV